MNQYYYNRLIEMGLDETAILNKVIYDNNDYIFVYTSHMEGLGTNNSDLDIFIITNKVPDIAFDRIENNIFYKSIYLPNIRLDIHYINYNDIQELFELAMNKKAKVDRVQLTILLKIMRSEILIGKKIDTSWKNEEVLDMLKHRVVDFYRRIATESLDDACILMSENELHCSLITLRNSINHALGAINALMGHSNLNYKWIPKIFLSSGINEDFKKRYNELFIFSSITEDNFKQYIKNMILFAQDLCSYIAFEL